MEHDCGPLAGEVVLAWRNLHLPGRTWSVRPRSSTRVAWHLRELLLRDVELRVQPGGRARAQREGQRNVHAYVRGTVAAAPDGVEWSGASYDPFHGPAAFTTLDGEAVGTAAWARLDGSGLWLAAPAPPAAV